MAHGEIAWTELFTGEVGASKRFYSAVFGWNYDSFPTEGYEYTVAKTSEGVAVAGMSPVHLGPVNTSQSYWLSTVEVDDVDAVVAMAAEHGAAIIQQPKTMQNIGRFAVLRDPNGAAIGLLQSLPPEEEPEENV
jgi:predicted enzyme related to lactoylglutathione lyase